MRVLLVSTDPAHSLGDALARPLGPSPRRVPTRRGALYAVELDADRALQRWIGARRAQLHRILGRGTYLDDDDIDGLLRLALPGVDELIGLLELTRLAHGGRYERIVVDTAPTGHTLRLLTMPATLRRIADVLDDMQAKHRFLAESLGGRYQPDAADALIEEIGGEGRALETLLRDSARCVFSWVLLPEALALEETADGIAALETNGIRVSEVIVNRVTSPRVARCALCEGRLASERVILDDASRILAGRPLRVVPALVSEPRGQAALRPLGRRLLAREGRPTDWPRRPAARAPGSGRAGRAPATRPIATREPSAPAAADEPWLATLVPSGIRLLLFAGKGGVGKTTCAAAIASALAERAPRARVLLLSTDPAHSLADVLGIPLGDDARPLPDLPRLHARELDAETLFERRRQRYRAAVDQVFAVLGGGSRFEPAFDRAVVEDLIDLAPPGIDELFGILSVIEALEPGVGGAQPYDVVVVDTAPTGHALRLLQMPDAGLEWVHAFMAILLKYRKVMGMGELGWDLVETSRELRALQALLRDAARAGVVVVTRPAELPRRETRRLVDGLTSLGIRVSGIVVNAVTPPACPRCRRAAARETRPRRALAREMLALSPRGPTIVEAPAVAPPPRGLQYLARWRRTWTRVER